MFELCVDNAGVEDISETLRDGLRYWSSTGTVSKMGCDSLLYCIEPSSVHELHVLQVRYTQNTYMHASLS